VTRVLSAVVLLPLVVGIVWFLPPLATLALAEVVLILAYVEYRHLVAALGVDIPAGIGGVAAAATCAVFAWPDARVEIVLMAALLVAGVSGVGAGGPSRDALLRVAGTTFASLYLGLPLGALVAVRLSHGPAAVLLLLLTIVVSDTAQYYGGRAFGRRPLAPVISPKKTVEGAVMGLIAGTVAVVVLGRIWLPGVSIPILVLLGPTLVALGMAGDLFESLIKRSAGVKDASSLIPGHGGVLDRIDALLFAAPVYYAVVGHLP
jgi:phosphatidate cytidylyltransferase